MSAAKIQRLQIRQPPSTHVGRMRWLKRRQKTSTIRGPTSELGVAVASAWEMSVDVVEKVRMKAGGRDVDVGMHVGLPEDRARGANIKMGLVIAPGYVSLK